MSFYSKFALTFAAVAFSATGALAQAGGADVPSNAKSQGAKENGPSSVGKPAEGDSMKKSDTTEKSGGSMMKKDDK